MLILSMVFCPVMVQYAHADAIVLPTLAVVTTILVACGFMASSDVDLEHAAQDFLKSCNSDALADIRSISTTLATEGIAGFSFKCTKSILSAIGSWFAAQDWTGFSDAGNTALGGFTLPEMSCTSFSETLIDFLPCVDASVLYACTDVSDFSTAREGYVIDKSIMSSFVGPSYFNTLGISSFDIPLLYSNNPTYDYDLYSSVRIQINSSSIVSYSIRKSDGSAGGYICSGCKSILLFHDSVSGVYGIISMVEPSLAKPWFFVDHFYDSSSISNTTFPTANVQSNSTYFPKEAVDSAAGSTTFPDQTASKPLTTDIPLNVPAEGVTSTTLPTDVRGDSQAGTEEGEATIIGWLGKIWDGVTSIPASIGAAVGSITSAIGDAVTSIADTLANFFNPSNFSLDFSKFKFGLTEIFPFCIPFDFVKGIKLLAADASAFNFNIVLDTKWFSIDHTVNLQPFRIPILFFRFIADFWFGFILISRTRDWIKW